MDQILILLGNRWRRFLSKLKSFIKPALKSISCWKFSRLRRDAIFMLLGLLAFTLSTCSIALGQAPIQQITEKVNNLPISQPSDEIPVPEIQNSNFTVSNTIGDIVYAPVKLDGYKLFDVASKLVLSQDQKKKDREMLPIEMRVQRIENALKTTLKVGDRQTLEVKVVDLYGVKNIIASDQKVLNDKLIGTVTDLDAQLYGVAVPELADEASKIVYQALIRAWSEREPEYLHNQLFLAIRIILGMLVISSILAGIQIFLKAQWRRLTECDQKKFQSAQSLIAQWKTFWQKRTKALRKFRKESIVNQESIASQESIVNLDADQESEYTAQREELLTNQEQQNRRKFLRNRNFFLRRILAIVQIVIWLFAIASILRLFPDTRELGLLLLDKPFRILEICLILILFQKGSEFMIDLYLQGWSEQKALVKSSSQRNALRSSTLAITFKRIVGAFLVILGIYLSLNELNIPIVGVLAGAGLVGFALSFALQDLIKDLINGFRIIWIDSFAVGDFIAIGDVFGLVEDLTLIHTQLRDWEGRLITIPNSEIRIVQNMTKNWSRVDFTVEVGYETDVDRAIAIVQKVAQHMYSEPEWHKLIIEPPELLGIEKLTHSGILIRLWIKTQPLQQWKVGREFRRCLKRAFDREGIAIGMPQQSLAVKNYANFREQSLIASQDSL